MISIHISVMLYLCAHFAGEPLYLLYEHVVLLARLNRLLLQQRVGGLQLTQLNR